MTSSRRRAAPIFQSEALRPLLAPSRIGIVGASERKFTQTLLDNLHSSGFEGDIVLSNPRHRSVFGRPCLPSLSEAPPVDVAILLTGRHLIEGVTAEVVDAGARSLMMFATGFRESGDPTWAATEARVVDVTRAAGLPMVGPNALGVVSTPARANMFASPVRWPIYSGRIGLVMQSGGVMAGAIRYLSHLRAGIKYAISSGNGSSVGVAEWLWHLAGDPEIDGIGLLVESIDDWGLFAAAMARARASRKWVGAVKVGRTERGRQAVATHTGALMQDYALYHDLFLQLGVVEAESVGELTAALALRERFGMPAKRGVAVMAVSGGIAGAMADLCEAAETPLAELRPATRRRVHRIHELLHPENPIDISTPAAEQPAAVVDAARAILGDPGVGVAVYALGQGIPNEDLVSQLSLMDRVVEAAASQSIPIVITQLTLSRSTAEQWRHLDGLEGALALESGTEAVRALTLWLGRQPAAAPPDHSAASSDEAQVATESHLKDRLRRAGLAVPLGTWFPRGAAIGDGAYRGPFPAVLKGVGAKIYHKARLGLVAHPLNDVSQLAEAFALMEERVGDLGLLVEGYLVEAEASPGDDVMVTFDWRSGAAVLGLRRGGGDVESGGGMRMAMWPPGAADFRRMAAFAGVSDGAAVASLRQTVGRLHGVFSRMRLQTLECNPVRILPGGECVVLDVVGVGQRSWS